MSRWLIEKDGTGIEKSGTGIEKSGTGIEKSGTGIEKSGTGIEKSGTGARKFWLASTLAAAVFSGGVNASSIDPAGSLQLVVNRNTIAVSWIFEGSVFSGISSLNGSFTSLSLTEVALSAGDSDAVGYTDVTGTGTGNSVKVTGSGTGNSVKVTGSGTGNSAQVTGSGTGNSAQVTGSGTGSSRQVTGTGTGSSRQVTGTGTGSSVRVASNGPSEETITVTLPGETGLTMEVSLGCGFATVAVVDSMSAPVAIFERVPVLGDTGQCTSAFGTGFKADPGRDFRMR